MNEASDMYLKAKSYHLRFALFDKLAVPIFTPPFLQVPEFDNAYANSLTQCVVAGPPAVSDITYVPVLNRFSYLSLVTNACSRKIVGWARRCSLAVEGPVNALKMALAQRLTKGKKKNNPSFRPKNSTLLQAVHCPSD